MIGEKLGSYEIAKRIGEGGMGEVYLAKHRHIDRLAAIKVLRPQLSGDKAGDRPSPLVKILDFGIAKLVSSTVKSTQSKPSGKHQAATWRY